MALILAKQNIAGTFRCQSKFSLNCHYNSVQESNLISTGDLFSWLRIFWWIQGSGGHTAGEAGTQAGEGQGGRRTVRVYHRSTISSLLDIFVYKNSPHCFPLLYIRMHTGRG